METTHEIGNITVIKVEVLINASLEICWEYFTNPEKIVQWAFASPEWHSPSATNDLRVDGHFSTRMEAKDGSYGFDFVGTYTAVRPLKHIAYTLGDDRKVTIDFDTQHGEAKVTQHFEAESQNTLELQQLGWQAILNNYKKLVESEN